MQSDLTAEEQLTWERMWNELYDRYYRAYFEELRAERLISIWNPVDTICRVLIACTASGSAISGWALWQQEGFRSCWTVIAGITAFIAIGYSVIGISERYREASVLHSDFSNLRMKLEEMRTKMSTMQYDSLSIYKHEFTKLIETYSDVVSRRKPSILISDSMETTLQVKLNKRLGL